MVTAATLLAAACATSACVVLPMRVTTRVRNLSGADQPLPKQAVVAGTTTRQDVDERYRGFAVDHGVPGLVWARYRKSSWTIVGAVINPLVLGAGGDRLWGTHDLLITFDDRDTVKRTVTVKDDALHPALARAASDAGLPELDLSDPLRLDDLDPCQCGDPPIDLELAASRIVVARHVAPKSPSDPPDPPIFTIVPVEQIDQVQAGGDTQDLGAVRIELRFKGKTEAGERLRLWVPPDAAITIVRWWERVKPERPGRRAGSYPPPACPRAVESSPGAWCDAARGGYRSGRRCIVLPIAT
jgi:hypothetical protein